MVPDEGGESRSLVTCELFVCDPARNTACTKELCFTRGGPCGATSRPEFAVRDLLGRPVKILKEGDGEPCRSSRTARSSRG